MQYIWQQIQWLECTSDHKIQKLTSKNFLLEFHNYNTTLKTFGFCVFVLFPDTSKNDCFTTVLGVIKYIFLIFRAEVYQIRGTFEYVVGILHKIQNFQVT